MVVLLDCQAGKASHDGLQLIVIRGLAGGDGQQGGQRCVSLCEVTDAAASLGWERRDAERLPGGVRIALYENLSRRGAGLAGLLTGGEPLPAEAAQGVVEGEAIADKSFVCTGQYDSGKAGFGGGVQFAFGGAAEFVAIVFGFPCLGAVEHENAGVPLQAEGVEAQGKLDYGRWGWVLPADDFAGDLRALLLEDDDAQIGPTAAGEIN